MPATPTPDIHAADLVAMLPPSRTALVVIDIQNDFAAPDGLIGRHGGDMTAAELAIDQIETLIAAARQSGITVAFMRVVTRPESDSDALKAHYARRGMPGGHVICRETGGGADYYRVTPEAGDIEIDKRLFDSFHGTDLDARLQQRGIDTLVVTGISTDCCVDQTARSAFHHGYHVFVVTDACASYDSDMHNHALKALQKHCALLTDSTSVISAWS